MITRFSLFKVVQILLPWIRRKVRFIAWTKVFVSYLAGLLEQLWQFWEATAKECKMTPQIIFLEHLLNERYGRTDIFISDGSILGPWIFSENEPDIPPFYLDQPDSWIWGESDSVTVDFVVNIPEILRSQAQIIAAMVQKYKLAGKQFIIQVF